MIKVKKIILAALAAGMFAVYGMAAGAEDSFSQETADENSEVAASDEAEQILQNMSLEDKVAQMFVITPDALTGVEGTNYAGDATRAAFFQYPVGGLVFFRNNIVSREQITEMTQMLQQYSRERTGLSLLLAVDEEGGTVTRVAGGDVSDIPYYGSMYEIGQTGDPMEAYSAGGVIGAYLAGLGFTVDFAPVADIWSNAENTVIGSRAFGNTAEEAAPMVAGFVLGLQNEGISGTLKHFPGHGNTTEDSHSGRAYSYRTLDELREEELQTFARGIEVGVDFVMTGHISLPNILGDDLQASMSEFMITDILRGELGFEGVVITDAMNMGAISSFYSSGEAAIRAICAGVDMILMPSDFYGAYEGVLNAVYNGTISEERINQSVRRIIEKKLEE